MSGPICISYIEAVITNGPKGWRDACQDCGLGATWLSQSSYNLHCSLIRFERQSGSINQSAHPATAGRFCPTVTSGPSRLWWDLITQQKQKQYHPSPRTTRASWILSPPPGTTVNPQHMPSTQPNLSPKLIMAFWSPLLPILNWAPLSLWIISTPPPLMFS